jgi:signal transduction histidine kinase
VKRVRLGTRLSRRWHSLPPRTIRLRLTVIYGLLFILCGASLLAITDVLVSHQESTGFYLGIARQAGTSIEVHIQASAHSGVTGSSNAGFGGQVKSVVPSSGSVAITAPAKGRASGPGKVLSSGGGAGSRAVVQRGSGVGLPSFPVLLASAKAQSGAALSTLLLVSGIALAIMALIATWLGWIVAGRALRPLRAITAAAREISASNLHRRLALDGPEDELKQLGNTFDALLERLETAFTAQRQFAANVSHELRTPLTLERTLLEVALADPAANAATLRAACERVLAGGEHLERLIDALLVLSRSQRGLDHRESVDLAAIATQTLATVDTDHLTVEQTLQPAHTDGDPRLIERLITNLITNAVQHNRTGGRLAVTTRTQERPILTVTNTGPVIPPADLERLFEPFQRLDGARTSNGDGLGLGLSIVTAIADAHAATITTSLPPDGGLSIEISFPATKHDTAHHNPDPSTPTIPIQANRIRAPAGPRHHTPMRPSP